MATELRAFVDTDVLIDIARKDSRDLPEIEGCRSWEKLNSFRSTESSCGWLELIMEDELMPRDRVASLLQEAEELTAIMTASRKTAKKTTENRQSKIGGRQ